MVPQFNTDYNDTVVFEVDAADINMGNASQKELRFALKFHPLTKGIISR